MLAVLAGALPAERRAIRLRRGGLRFAVRDRMDVWAVQEVALDRHYERFGFAVQPGWSVLDVGGGLGDYALLVAREHPDARVVAFEPFAGSRALFEANRAANGLERVQVRPEAVGDAGFVRYVDGGRGPGEFRAVPAASGDAGVIESVPLDEALDRAGMARCDLAKIDCEGAEFPMLLHASDAALARVDRIVLEYHDAPGRHHEQIASRLRQAGYVVERFPSIHTGLGYLRASRPAGV